MLPGAKKDQALSGGSALPFNGYAAPWNRTSCVRVGLGRPLDQMRMPGSRAVSNHLQRVRSASDDRRRRRRNNETAEQNAAAGRMPACCHSLSRGPELAIPRIPSASRFTQSGCLLKCRTRGPRNRHRPQEAQPGGRSRPSGGALQFCCLCKMVAAPNTVNDPGPPLYSARPVRCRS